MNVALLEYLCKQRGEKITNVIQSLNLGKGSLSNWRNGATPNGETLIKLAKHFNVSTDFLLGLSDDNPNKNLNEINQVYKKIESILDEILEAATTMKNIAGVK